MNDAYSKLRSVLETFVAGAPFEPGEAVLSLLAEYRIRPRDKDGVLLLVTVSRPTTDPDAFVVGLRYRKRSGALTEDLFQVDRATGVTKNVDANIELRLPEYSKTHKQQVFPQATSEAPPSITAVNTFIFKP